MRSPRPLRRPDPRALPEHPAPRLGLQPRRPPAREGLPRRARARRHREHVRHRPRGDRPPARTARRSARSLVLGYDDAASAADHVMDVLEHKPLGLEGVDEQLIDDMTMLGMHEEDLSMLPDGRGWLLVEFGGETKEEADEKAHALMADLKKSKDAAEGHEALRRPAGRAARLGGPRGRPRRDRVHPRQARHVRGLGGLGGPAGAPRRLPPRARQAGRTSTATRARSTATTARAASTRAGTSTCRRRKASRPSGASSTRPPTSSSSMGGSLSGEHGDGQSRGELLPKMFGPELIEAFREFKSIWDPDWKMNPGKVVDPYRIVDNLRLGTDYAPPRVEDALHVPDDNGSLRPRDHALRRDRQVPPDGLRKRRHVPELHGHARGEALDPRPRAPALGDAERRGDRALEGRGGLRRARPVPLVQGLHERLPGQRRHARP